MPVMKQLNVGGTTYDTVGEASVTQVVSSGTKIATVSIDGTSTDLYAPSGGSSVEPATAAPIVDGTAAVGTSAKYAREDHVHPTDTSRAAASHTHAIGDVTNLQSSLDGKAASSHSHGYITNIGAIESDTAVASGDKLVIADSSDSSKLKRSGIAFGSDTTTFLRNDGQWAAAGGGGGYDLTIDVVVDDTSGSLISHNVVAADCIDFVKSFVAGNDVRAVAYMRWHAYDDEDEYYSSAGCELRLTEVNASSYGVGQYEADGGWGMTFENVVMTVQGARAAYFIQSRLRISGVNDDPGLSPTVASTRTSVSLS